MSIFSKSVGSLVIVVSLFASCTKDDYRYPTGGSYTLTHQFRDDFNNDSNVWTYTDMTNLIFISIGNGNLNYICHPTDTFPKPIGSNRAIIATGMEIDSNYSITTSFKTDNKMGLVFGISDTSDGYGFIIDYMGRYAFYNLGIPGKQAPQHVVEWQFSTAVNMSTWNTLKIERVGNVWMGYINDVKLFTVTARQLFGNKAGYLVEDGTNGYAEYLDIKW